MSDDGLAAVIARVVSMEDRVRAVVAHRRSGDPAPDDPFRGLYLDDDTVDRLLADRDPPPPWEAAGTNPPGAASRLDRLVADAGLTELDLHVLVAALLPDVDSRFEKLYGYLNDDVTRRRATVGLALELAGVPAASAPARARLLAGGPLTRHGLLVVDDLDRPFLTRSLRVPDRVAAHLLGDDGVDPDLVDVLAPTSSWDAPVVPVVVRAIAAGVGLVHVREKVTGTGAALAVAAVAELGRPAVVLDLARLATRPEARELVVSARREVLLRGGVLVAAPVEALAGALPAVLRDLVAEPGPVVVVGTTTWDPGWSEVVPLSVDAGSPDSIERSALWRRELGEDHGGLDAGVTDHFVLGPMQVLRAVRAARVSSLAHGGATRSADLVHGARAQNAAGLERLARRIEPGVGWDDLVLPPAVLRALHDIADRALHREQVLTTWRMRPGGGRGTGITALFAGDSGTGKTMSAEVIAGRLGLDLYTVNLATVIDKYVGETEKNLERIFAEAGGVNAVLLFDEADAIFGKRSEVRDAHDRYANIESAYLLQRMETFDGLALLATNLRSNVDDAFVRRLDAIVEFPAPSERMRRELWQRCLAPPVPCADDLDLEFCAASFSLSGGNIRSVATTAAYRAAAAGTPVTMADLIAATALEYRKLGRLVLEQEFGDYAGNCDDHPTSTHEETPVKHSEIDDAGTSLRPRSGRTDHDHDAPAPAWQAAASGRTDALDGAAVLGLQRTVGNAATTAAVTGGRSSVHEVVGSGGAPLDADLRADMEARLGHDFGDVRVHDGAAAHDSARSVGAHAYTVGRDIVFQRNAYDPSSSAGRTMLAHELTHVVQQRQGPVDGTPAAGGIRVSDPSDRFEREAVANAERVMGAAPTVARDAVAPSGAGGAGGDIAIQRDAAEEEDGDAPVQGTFVQREEAEEETAEG